MDLPGFYYDEEKKKYFRIQPGNNNNNPLTQKQIDAKEFTKKQPKRAKKLPGNIVQNYLKHQIGFMSSQKFADNTKAIRYNDFKFIPKCRTYIPISFQKIIALPRLSRAVLVARVKSISTIYNIEIEPKHITSKPICPIPMLVRSFSALEEIIDFTSYSDKEIVYLYRNPPSHGDETVYLNILPWNGLPKSLRTGGINQFLPARCIAFYKSVNKIAVGMNGKIAMFSCRSATSQLITSPGKVTAWSLCFNEKTNVLHVGSNTGVFMNLDCRDMARKSKGIKLFDHVVSDIQMLDKGYTAVVSSVGNQIKLFDIRMNKSIFDFELRKIKNPHLYRIPTSIDETANMMCSPGQDGATRFWDLRNGCLINTVTKYVSKELPCPYMPCAAFSDNWNNEPGLSCLITCDHKGQIMAGYPTTCSPIFM